MKAAVLHEFKKALVLEDVPRPLLEANEVLIQVEACGLCHSDLHVVDGDWPQFLSITKMPLIPGHEIAGRIVEKGSDVRELQVGDRKSLRTPENHGSDGGWWLRRICKSSREPCCENPGCALSGGSGAAVLRRRNGLSSLEAGANFRRTTAGNLRNWWPRPSRRANRERTRSGNCCH